MKVKFRLISIVLIGILIGVAAVKLQQSADSLDARLVSADDATRAAALRVFNAKSEGARASVVDALISQRLVSGEAKERQFALYALRKSGLSSPKVIQPMVNGLSDTDQKVREESIAGLLEMGEPALPFAVNGLGKDARTDEQLISLISKSSPNTVPLLVAALQDTSNVSRRRSAALTFSRLPSGEVRTAAKAATPALVDAVKATDNALAFNAALALRVIDPLNTAGVPVLLRHVEIGDWDKPEIRGWDAAQALSEIPAAAAKTTPVLTRILLASNDGFDRSRRFRRPFLAERLDALSPRPRKVSDLTWDLKNRDAAIRYRAVMAIGNNAAMKEPLIASLIPLLDDKDEFVAARAAWALTRIGLQNTPRYGAQLYPRYVDLLGRIDEAIIPGFVRAAGMPLGGMNDTALPAIVDAVRTGHLRLEKADVVLRGCSDGAVKFLSATMAHNASSEVRLMSAIALARLAPKTPGLGAELQKGSNRTGQVGEDVKAALADLEKSGRKK